MNADLSIIEPLDQALATAQSIPELREFHDQATAAKAYAKARGMGIEQENRIATYILKAEHRIGRALIDLTNSGLFGRSARGTYGHPERAVAAAQDLVSVEDLGLTYAQSSDFQRLAALPDDKFESMLREAMAWGNGTRIAKVNFYRAGARAKGSDYRPTPENPDFEAFRKGVYGMLGYATTDEGYSGFTKNDLHLLPLDELMTVVTCIKGLLAAYQEVKAARG